MYLGFGMGGFPKIEMRLKAGKSALPPSERISSYHVVQATSTI
jgi:hypothetical protein